MLSLRQLVEQQLRPALAAKGIRLLGWRELPAAEQARLAPSFATRSCRCSRLSRSTCRGRFRC
jgi:hypothetical protein